MPSHSPIKEGLWPGLRSPQYRKTSVLSFPYDQSNDNLSLNTCVGTWIRGVPCIPSDDVLLTQHKGRREQPYPGMPQKGVFYHVSLTWEKLEKNRMSRLRNKGKQTCSSRKFMANLLKRNTIQVVCVCVCVCVHAHVCAHLERARATGAHYRETQGGRKRREGRTKKKKSEEEKDKRKEEMEGRY